MDRQIVYPGQIPLETDLLNSNRYALIGLAKLAAAVLGTNTLLNGLGCAPMNPAALQVQLGAGEIYALANLDGTAYSSLAADTAHSLLKQGLLLDAVTLDCPAPATAGDSVDYLVQIGYFDQDSGATALPYYNAANPAQAYSGPNNSGTAQHTVRQGICQVAVKAGIAATSGSQVAPAPDPGYVGAYVVTVANGQSAITAADIQTDPAAPFITETLTQKISQATGDSRYAQLAQIQSGTLLYAVDSGAANAYAISLTPAPAALADGMTVRFRAANANTGPSTLNVNGFGDITLAGMGGALQGGEIIATAQYTAIYRAGWNLWLMLGSTGGALSIFNASKSQHAVARGQVLQTPPQLATIGVSVPAASTSYTTSVTFTAPCAGHVVAQGDLAIGGGLAAGAFISYKVGINGIIGDSDSNRLPLNALCATLIAAPGDSVTATFTATTNTTAPGVSIRLHVFSFFLPIP